MWSRVRDWLIGAFVMLVLVVGALAVGLWVMTSPAGSGETAPGGSSPGPSAESPTPPTDLEGDEVWLSDVDLGSGSVVFPVSTLQDVEAEGQGLRSGPDRLVADWLQVHGTVPFSEVAAELGGTLRSARPRTVGPWSDGRWRRWAGSWPSRPPGRWTCATVSSS